MAEFAEPLTVLSVLLPYLAGTTICAASLPRTVGLLLGHPPSKDRIDRNLIIAIGNAQWVAYGALAGIAPIMVFSSISLTLHLVIAGWMWWDWNRKP